MVAVLMIVSSLSMPADYRLLTESSPTCARTSSCMDGYMENKPGSCCPAVQDGSNPYNGYWCCQWQPSKVTMTNKCSKDVKVWGQTSPGAYDAKVIAAGQDQVFAAGAGFVPALEERFTFSFITAARNDRPPSTEQEVVFEMNPYAGNQIGDQDFWWPQVIHSSFITQKGFTDLNLDVAFLQDDNHLVCDDQSGSSGFSRARTQFKTSECASLGEHAMDSGFEQKTCVPTCPGDSTTILDPNTCPTVSQSCVIKSAICPGGHQDAPCTPVEAPEYNTFAKYGSENSLQCKGGKWWRSPPSVGNGWREDWKSTPMTYTKDASATFECWDAGKPGPEGMNFCDFPIQGGSIAITMCPGFTEDSSASKLKGDGTEPCDAP